MWAYFISIDQFYTDSSRTTWWIWEVQPTISPKKPSKAHCFMILPFILSRTLQARSRMKCIQILLRRLIAPSGTSCQWNGSATLIPPKIVEQLFILTSMFHGFHGDNNGRWEKNEKTWGTTCLTGSRAVWAPSSCLCALVAFLGGEAPGVVLTRGCPRRS